MNKCNLFVYSVVFSITLSGCGGPPKVVKVESTAQRPINTPEKAETYKRQKGPQ
jgi:hypothetical protein